jgi:hypothetical protein
MAVLRRYIREGGLFRENAAVCVGLSGACSGVAAAAAIAAVRATPGVESVAVPRDGDEFDDDGTVYQVCDGGRRWRVRRSG